MSNWLPDGDLPPLSAESSKQEAVLRELYNHMIRVAYSKVRNKSDAHDVVQDAWVKMLSNHATLREESKLTAWAKAITKNVALNVNKTAGRIQPCEEWPSAVDHSAALTEAELMMEISELLGALDPTTRTLILYKFYYGFKDQEIADVMKMPVGTVKAKIHRTKERLKRTDIAPNM
ncbi:RNA polymerase subunit sigma-70 [Paenibacillus sambharensis]|uniref:RNA polymerase subunit sigma-70 n=1 Tax=Paenibacillus sambharensis TaxID=1803190 RepID=A0A2W1LH03_9BACL|nr:RNA polymerase sigma factor [Paenibacillus sambharensis]PZD94322.1 RNA polymerase subunit sigma-70 [Paenibacillus sambharensis]